MDKERDTGCGERSRTTVGVSSVLLERTLAAELELLVDSAEVGVQVLPSWSERSSAAGFLPGVVLAGLEAVGASEVASSAAPDLLDARLARHLGLLVFFGQRPICAPIISNIIG